MKFLVMMSFWLLGVLNVSINPVGEHWAEMLILTVYIAGGYFLSQTLNNR